MKKICVLAAVFALVAGTVMADDSPISFGAWGRGTFWPLSYNTKTENGTVSLGPAWETLNNPRVGFTVRGETADIGFVAEVRAASTFKSVQGDASDFTITDMVGVFGVNDNAKVWVKPFGNVLKITAGKYNEDALRGKMGGELRPVVLYNPSGDEDDLFRRFQANTGVYIEATPTPELLIGWNITNLVGKWSDTSTYGDDNIENAYKYSQVGAGYKVGNVAHIRAQYDGRGGEDNEKAAVAVAYTGIAGLTVDVGGVFYFDEDAGKPAFTVGVDHGNAGTAGGIKLRGRVKAVTNDDVYLGLQAGGEYGISDDVGAGANVGFGLNDGYKDSNYLGLSAYVRKTLAKGEIEAGVTTKIDIGDDAADTGTTIAFPIAFTYSF